MIISKARLDKETKISKETKLTQKHMIISKARPDTPQIVMITRLTTVTA